ncbi:MAG: hypothetical protein ACTSXQ_06785 [Alphaproteobacteria bacterium]
MSGEETNRRTFLWQAFVALGGAVTLPWWLGGGKLFAAEPPEEKKSQWGMPLAEHYGTCTPGEISDGIIVVPDTLDELNRILVKNGKSIAGNTDMNDFKSQFKMIDVEKSYGVVPVSENRRIYNTPPTRMAVKVA